MWDDPTPTVVPVVLVQLDENKTNLPDPSLSLSSIYVYTYVYTYGHISKTMVIEAFSAANTHTRWLWIDPQQEGLRCISHFLSLSLYSSSTSCTPSYPLYLKPPTTPRTLFSVQLFTTPYSSLFLLSRGCIYSLLWTS